MYVNLTHYKAFPNMFMEKKSFLILKLDVLGCYICNACIFTKYCIHIEIVSILITLMYLNYIKFLIRKLKN